VVHGAIVNLIRTPTIKYCPNTKDKGGFQCYIDRLRQWYIDENAKSPDDSPLYQGTVRFSGSEPVTQEFALRLSRYVKEAASGNPNVNEFPRAGGSRCTNRFNKPCPYLGLCSVDPVLWPSLVRQGLYQISFREDEESNSQE
jgi:hypothetical protein